MAIERKIYSINRKSGSIRVTTKCTHQKQIEKVEKEMEKLGFKVDYSEKIGSDLFISGEFIAPFKEDIIRDIDKKLEDLSDNGWEITEGTKQT